MFAIYRGIQAYERTIDTMVGQVALTAFYQTPDKATQFATTFFNQTIDIVETKKLVDVELISLYATILALLAGVGALKSRARVSLPNAQFASRAATQAIAWTNCGCVKPSPWVRHACFEALAMCARGGPHIKDGLRGRNGKHRSGMPCISVKL